MTDEAKRRFNADLSVDKTTTGTFNDIEVLSYRNKNGLAYRDPAELLAHLLYPEHPRREPETAAACVGIAQAAMGSSKMVYDVCRDVFNFLVEVLKHQPKYDPWDYNRPRTWKSTVTPMTIDQFPSFESTWLQNFSTLKITKSDMQRLWPTKPTGDINFRFLLD